MGRGGGGGFLHAQELLGAAPGPGRGLQGGREAGPRPRHARRGGLAPLLLRRAPPAAPRLAAHALRRTRGRARGANPPRTELLLQFDQPLSQRLLAFHTSWLSPSTLSRARTAWLYAILSRLDKPLHEDTAAMVRSLYCRCCEVRASIAGGLGDAEGTPQELTALNVLVVVCARYYGQGDMQLRNAQRR